MILQPLLSKIRRIGVDSGVITIEFCETAIVIHFFDEDSNVFETLYSIELGEFCFIKESNVIGEFNLSCIKNSEEAKAAEKLLKSKGIKKKSELVAKANELASEIIKMAGIPVKVIPRIKGNPYVSTVFDNNMWHARQVLQGIDDDY
jgi:hypothetical protein